MIDHTLVRQNTIFGDGVVTGDLAINGGDLTSISTTFNLFASNVVTANLFTSATTIAIGAAGVGSKTTINSAQVLVGDGTALLPVYSFASDPNTGIYNESANTIGIATNGSLKVRIDGSGLTAATNFIIGGGVDVILSRDAANTLALRNGVNAQTFRAYTSYTDASNYERFAINTAAGAITLAAETLGTGTDNIDIVLSPAGTGGVRIPTTTPAAGVADAVLLYSSDISAGNTEPSFYCEGTAVLATGQADSVSSVRVKMRINGTEVTLLAI